MSKEVSYTHTPMMKHYLDVYYFPFVFNALNLR